MSMSNGQANRDSGLRVLFRALWVVRVPLTSALLSLLIFWNLPQARDLFIDIKGDVLRGVLFWTSFYIVVVLAWLVPVYCSSRLSLESEAERIGTGEAATHQWLNFAIPAGLIFTCLASLIIGNAYSYIYLLDTRDSNVHTLAKEHLSTTLVVSISFILAFFVITALLARRSFVKRKSYIRGGRPWAKRAIAITLEKATHRLTKKDWNHPDTFLHLAILSIFSIFSVILWIIEPKALAKIFPRATITPILLGFWVAPLTILGLLSHRTRWPLIFFFVAGCILLDSVLDNHKVRTVELRAAESRVDLATALGRWREVNGCEPTVPDVTCRRPIIVAAAGGASRAAFFTASVLGFIEDISLTTSKLNRFSDQLFAISSVSGSSLGAVTYLALLDAVAEDTQVLARAREGAASDGLWYGNEISAPEKDDVPTVWKDALQIALAGDFLTPVAAAWMFRDLMPIGGIFGADDRATVLEQAWESRFEKIFMQKGNKNPLERPLTSFAPQSNRWRPVLFLNGTIVENGKRIIVSPIAPPMKEYPCRLDCDPGDISEFYTDAYDFHDLINGSTSPYEERSLSEERRIKSDVRLSTAALLSARFPAISPHGTIRNRSSNVVGHVVDGGYFENNGALTTMDILNGLKIISAAEDTTAGRRVPCRYLSDDGDNQCKPSDLAQDCTPGDRRCVLRSQKIWPLIIQISNDPGTQACGEGEVDPGARLALPVAERWRFFPSLMFVIDGVLGARVARGTHASELLSYFLDDDKNAYFPAYDDLRPGFVHFRVCPQAISQNADSHPTSTSDERLPKVVSKEMRFRDVSMSWWLSKPVQAYLDDQICNANNKAALVKVLMALSKEAVAFMPDKEDDLQILHSKYKNDVDGRCRNLFEANQSIADAKPPGK
jgi:hypothetical protein